MNIEITENVTVSADYVVVCEQCGSKLDADIDRHGQIQVIWTAN